MLRANGARPLHPYFRGSIASVHPFGTAEIASFSHFMGDAVPRETGELTSLTSLTWRYDSIDLLTCDTSYFGRMAGLTCLEGFGTRWGDEGTDEFKTCTALTCNFLSRFVTTILTSLPGQPAGEAWSTIPFFSLHEGTLEFLFMTALTCLLPLDPCCSLPDTFMVFQLTPGTRIHRL